MKTKIFIFTMSFLASWSLFSQNNPGDLFPNDSIFFEYNTIPYNIDTVLSGNCWQVGHPSKTFFNLAYSPPLAIVTDTLHPYPVNTQSSFTFLIIDTMAALGGGPPCGGATYLQFNHKYDSDTLADYGYVEFSFDHGNTWNIAKDTIQMGPWDGMIFRWEDDYTLNTGTYSNHPLYISGHSDGWIVSRYVWQWFIPVKKVTMTQFPDTIVVRFSFHSDNIQTNKEGWMVDNIITGCMELGSGISTNQDNDYNYISPNPLTTVSLVTCPIGYSNSTVEIYDVTGRLVFNDHLDQNGTLQLNRKDFSPGVFIWSIKSKEKSVATGKLVVQ
jgi:hypothetical protein